MDCTEIDLALTFADIYDRAYPGGNIGSGGGASCENALLALEAARVGMPVEDFTAKYNAWVADAIPF